MVYRVLVTYSPFVRLSIEVAKVLFHWNPKFEHIALMLLSFAAGNHNLSPTFISPSIVSVGFSFAFFSAIFLLLFNCLFNFIVQRYSLLNIYASFLNTFLEYFSVY